MQIKRQVFEAFDLQILYDRRESRVEARYVSRYDARIVQRLRLLG